MTNQADKVTLLPTSHPDVFHRHLDVIVNKGLEGYGFVLRGSKSDGLEEMFSATAWYPGLQYLESVETSSNAYNVGLRAGDYILKINSIDVTSMGHQQTVNVIQKCKGEIHLHAVRVINTNSESSRKGNGNGKLIEPPCSDSSMTSSLPTNASFSRHDRTGSIISAIGKLDSVLAMEDNGSSGGTIASLRRLPAGRNLRPENVQDIFRHDLKQTPHTFSTTTGRHLLEVTPPAIPTGVLVDEVSHHGATYPSNNAVQRSNTFSANVGHAPRTNATLSSSHSFKANDHQRRHISSVTTKNAPATPTRKTSRLMTNARDGREPHTLVVAQPPQVPPTSFQASQPTHSSFQPPPSSFQPTPSSFQPPPSSFQPPPSSFQPPPSSFQPTPSSVQVPQPYGAQAAPPAKGTPHLHSSTQAAGRPAIIGNVGGANLSGIAAAVAVQAQQRQKRLSSSDASDKSDSPQLNTSAPCKSPPAVSRKPSRKFDFRDRAVTNGESAFSVALAAKEASLRKRSQTEPVQASDQTESKPATNDLKDLMNLPPPPPPSSVWSKSSNYDPTMLPPPPASMMASPILPSPHFTVDSKSTKPPSTAFSTSQSKDDTDSGVDEVASNRPSTGESRTSIETLSVVSSLSTLSSEEGSDAGVSLSYDSRSNSDQVTGNVYLDALKKNKSTSHRSGDTSAPTNGIVLTKVNFSTKKPSNTEPPFTQGNRVNRPDVTKQDVCNDKKVVPTPAADYTNDVKTKPVEQWTVDDVSKWLNELGLEVHAQVFAENEIDGSHLPELGKEDLQELGVTRVGHRLTIERSLKKLTGK